MPWSKLDDGFHEHPKIVAMTDKAFRLYVCAITYSSRHGLAGRLTRTHVAVLMRLTGAKQKHVDELVSITAWDLDGDDHAYHIHGFDEYNRHNESVSAIRSQIGREGGLKSGQSRRDKAAAKALLTPEAHTSLPNHAQSEREANEAKSKQLLPEIEAKAEAKRSKGTPDPDPDPTTGPSLETWKSELLRDLARDDLPPNPPSGGAAQSGPPAHARMDAPVPARMEPEQAEPPAIVPKAVTRNGTSKGAKPVEGVTDAWEAYARSYAEVYKVPPVRNGKVMGQLAQLVQRVGREDAVRMCAWWPTHRAYLSVQNKHTVGLLLMQCEGLHTEMLRGVTVHSTDARQIDEQAAQHEMWRRIERKLDEKQDQKQDNKQDPNRNGHDAG